jgi:HAD superfamily hydrolase (TIGR01509 family)
MVTTTRVHPHPRPDAAPVLHVHAIVFDMDGLLLDTETLALEGLRHTAEAMRLDIPASVFQAMIGAPIDQCRLLLLRHVADGSTVDAFLGSAAAHTEARIDAGFLRVKAGAEELLAQAAAAGIPMAVATSSRRAKALHHLRAAGIVDRFQAIVTRDDVERGKPHPDLFQKAVAALGESPTRCLALEDSYNGVRSAHAAGVPVMMVPDLLPPTDEMRRLCVAVLPDLHAVLGQVVFGPPGQGGEGVVESEGLARQ